MVYVLDVDSELIARVSSLPSPGYLILMSIAGGVKASIPSFLHSLAD
jgi:hypothetical protein